MSRPTCFQAGTVLLVQLQLLVEYLQKNMIRRP